MTGTGQSRLEKSRSIARWVLAALYFLAGVIHVLRPDWFMPVMPGWVPMPWMVILATGVCEIAGAIGLLDRRFRQAAGIGLALYAVCVYPANIKHAIDDLSSAQPSLGWWYHAPRLALQPSIVWWALFAGRTLDWPFRASK